MQFTSFALVALLASFSYAQSIEQELAKIPSCGITCITAASESAGCAATDFTCQCGSKREAITQAAIPCVATSCQASDLGVITQASLEICRLVTLGGITSGVSSLIASATSAAGAAATGKTGSSTASGAATSSTGNAASNVRFGAAGVAAGMGAVVAAFAL